MLYKVYQHEKGVVTKVITIINTDINCVEYTHDDFYVEVVENTCENKTYLNNE